MADLTHEAATVYTDVIASALDALGNDLNACSCYRADVNVTSVGHIYYLFCHRCWVVGAAAVAVRTPPIPFFPSLEIVTTHEFKPAWVDPDTMPMILWMEI